MRRPSWPMLTLLLVTAAVAGGCSSGPSATTAKFPTKPIAAVTPGTPAAPSDVFMRTLGKAMEREWGVPVTVDNKPGANGATAVQALLGQPADGHAFMNFNKSHTVAMADNALGSYTNPDQVLLVGQMQGDSWVVAVKANSAWKSLADLVSYAKANPGKLSVGGASAVSAASLSAMVFAKKADFQWKWIAYTGQEESNMALLSGEVQVDWGSIAMLGPFERSGDFKMLAVSASNRLPQWPNLPTFKELGYDLVDSNWRGIALRPGTPANVLEAYYSVLKKAAKDPELASLTEKEGMTILGTVGSQVQGMLLQEFNDARSVLASLKKK